jgi:hypothetical protein
MISPDFDWRAKEIHEVTEAMIKHLADLSGDLQAQHEVVQRLMAYLAMIERSQLPELEARQ